MMHGFRIPSFLAFASTMALSACGQQPIQSSHTAAHAVPELVDGKGDNYISTNAREFTLRGHSHVALPADFESLDEAARAQRLQSLAQSRLGTINRAIQGHVEKLVREANETIPQSHTKFFTYFRSKQAAVPTPELTGDGRARFAFALEFVGSPTVMNRLAPDDKSPRAFDVEVKDWNETTAEVVRVEILGSQSRDAFPKYNELFADGVFDIGMHFGGDYNAERYDIETAKWTVDYLLEQGFKNASVTRYEELTLDSPPFVQEIVVEGRTVEVRVYVYHAEMDGPGEQARLADVMRQSLAERDVVLYSGHAGPGAGFILDYHPKYEIRPSEFATIPMAQKYQIYVFDGCQTYRTYVDDVLKNPSKTFDNLNVVTTVNATPFSIGYQTIHQLLYWFTFTDDAGRHYPMSWQAILRGLNTREYNDIYYGVHGVDNAPQINPHDGLEALCRACQGDGDCGAGGNLCLDLEGGSACGVACTSDAACGRGYRCERIYEGEENFYIPKQCVPRNKGCQETP